MNLPDLSRSRFSEFARQWLLISRRKPYQIGSGEHKLLVHAGGSAVHSELLHRDVREGAYPIEFGKWTLRRLAKQLPLKWTGSIRNVSRKCAG